MAIARSASPAWTASGVSAAIHQTRAYRSAFTSANRAASVLLPTPPNPCIAAIATLVAYLGKYAHVVAGTDAVTIDCPLERSTPPPPEAQ